jgi:3-deoxy-D-manno-octulosonic-acid transferase
MWRRGGYKKDFLHRFGRFHQLPPKKTGRKRIWLQAVSVGEVVAVGPLIKSLQENAAVEVVLTTTTSTGYAEARKRYEGYVLSVGIFPLDFYFFSKAAWRRIAPDSVILTESELWPEHLHQARLQNVPTFLVNARISDRSFKRYLRFQSLAKRLLSRFSRIYPASQLDQQRIFQLGAQPEKVEFFGSIKLDTPLPSKLDREERTALMGTLGFETEEKTKIILGSSTWPGEEDALIQITGLLLEEGFNIRLLLVPRHAERGREIAQSLEKQAVSWSQRSNNFGGDQAVIIHLADTTGELSQLAQVADIAFVGKSLDPNNGGQSPIEAAGMGIPLVFGPNMSNFKAIAAQLISLGAAIVVQDGEELERTLRRLIDDSQLRQKMATAGRNWHSANRGSSQRIAKSIRIHVSTH